MWVYTLNFGTRNLELYVYSLSVCGEWDPVLIGVSPNLPLFVNLAFCILYLLRMRLPMHGMEKGHEATVFPECY